MRVHPQDREKIRYLANLDTRGGPALRVEQLEAMTAVARVLDQLLDETTTPTP